MSCSGCRVLRKGCSDNCILRQSLQWIESAESQAAATLFVAKFFGRAGLMSFLESVSEPQRPDLFKSLLYEACGRTINPVNGAVGLLWTGKWDKCQAAVQTVLSGQNLSRHSAPADDNMDLPGVYNIPVSIRRVRQKTLHENEKALCNADSDAADLRLSMPGPKCVSTTANMKKQRISSSVDNASRFSYDESAEKTLEDQQKYHICLHKSLHMQPEQ